MICGHFPSEYAGLTGRLCHWGVLAPSLKVNITCVVYTFKLRTKTPQCPNLPVRPAYSVWPLHTITSAWERHTVNILKFSFDCPSYNADSAEEEFTLVSDMRFSPKIHYKKPRYIKYKCSFMCPFLCIQWSSLEHKRTCGTRWRSWLAHSATSWKFAGSIPDEVIGIFHWRPPSGCTMALELIQSLTEMSKRKIS